MPDSFHGIDIDRASSLSTTLLDTAGNARHTASLVGGAERLCELTTGATPRLDQIGTDCNALADTVRHASGELVRFQLPPIDSPPSSVVLDPQRSPAHPLTIGDGQPRYIQGTGHPATDQTNVRDAAMRAIFDHRMRQVRNDVERHLRTHQASRFAPFVDHGNREYTISTSDRERWIERTRWNPDDTDGAAEWGADVGLDVVEATIALAQYRSLADKNVNRPVLDGHDVTVGTIVETEARARFADLTIRASVWHWWPNRLVKEQDSAVSELLTGNGEHDEPAGLALSLLVAKNRLGDPLPTLSEAEIEFCLETDTTVTGDRSALVMDLLDALAQPSDSALAVGLRGLATLADGAQLLAAVIKGDEDAVHEIASEIALGGVITRAARWLAPRALGGAAATMLLLLLALTGVERPGEPDRPPNPPRTGWIDEYGRQRGNGTMNRSGITDVIAHR